MSVSETATCTPRIGPSSIRDGRTPSLAPAYDYVSTLLYVEAESVGVDLAGTKQFLDIDIQRLMRLAARRARLDENSGNASAPDG